MTHPQTDARRDELVEVVAAYVLSQVTVQEDHARDISNGLLRLLEAAGVDLGGWMEIESAPKPKDAETYSPVFLIGTAGEFETIEAAQTARYESVFQIIPAISRKKRPTHWRPLPTPPKDTSNG